jgi:rubredoxin
MAVRVLEPETPIPKSQYTTATPFNQLLIQCTCSEEMIFKKKYQIVDKVKLLLELIYDHLKFG